MALGKKRAAGELIQVPMSSMIDVVFLLLIYFIVTQKDEISEAHLAVNLPSPSMTESTEKPPPILELEVHPGRVLLQRVPRSLDTIKERLTYLAELDRDQTVMVKTSVMARAEELVAVLDICRGAGLSKLNVVTLK